MRDSLKIGISCFGRLQIVIGPAPEWDFGMRRTGASTEIHSDCTRTVKPRTIRPGVRIAFVRGPQTVLMKILDRDVA